MAKQWLTSRKFFTVIDLKESLDSLVDIASAASEAEDFGKVLADEILVRSYSSECADNEAILYQETLSDESHVYAIEIHA